MLVRESFLREGLQTLPNGPLSVEIRANLAERIARAGFSFMEVTSYIPKMYTGHFIGREDLLEKIRKRTRGTEITLGAFVPNLTGFENAVSDIEQGIGVDEVGVIVSASEQHNVDSVERSVAETLDEIKEITHRAERYNVGVYCYVSAAFGYVYNGVKCPQDSSDVASLVEEVIAAGCDYAVVADTVGLGTPNSVREVLNSVKQRVDLKRVCCHFHDHRGRGLINSIAAADVGILGLDCTIGGIGGYPGHFENDRPELRWGANVDTLSLVCALSDIGHLDRKIDIKRLSDLTEYVVEIPVVQEYVKSRLG